MRAAVDVERRMKSVFFRLLARDVDRVFVGDPAGVDAVHVDPVLRVVRGRGAGHHVERGFRHVRMGVLVGLEPSIKLPLHRRHVDDVLVEGALPQHERLQSAVQDEGGDCVHELNLEELDRPHFVQRQTPAVDPSQVDLLLIGVEPTVRVEMWPELRVLRRQEDLRERGGDCDPRAS